MLYKLIAFKGHLWDCLGIFRESYWDTFRQIFTLSLINQTVRILSHWENVDKILYGNHFMQTTSHDVAEQTIIIVKRSFALPCHLT